MHAPSRTRRGLLAAAGLAGLAPRLTAAAPPAPKSHPKDGDEALALLKAGNARFVSGQTHHAHESAEWREHLLCEQKPFATVLGGATRGCRSNWS